MHSLLAAAAAAEEEGRDDDEKLDQATSGNRQELLELMLCLFFSRKKLKQNRGWERKIESFVLLASPLHVEAPAPLL